MNGSSSVSQTSLTTQVSFCLFHETPSGKQCNVEMESWALESDRSQSKSSSACGLGDPYLISLNFHFHISDEDKKCYYPIYDDVNMKYDDARQAHSPAPGTRRALHIAAVGTIGHFQEREGAPESQQTRAAG